MNKKLKSFNRADITVASDRHQRIQESIGAR